jgi:hypothetical protein
VPESATEYGVFCHAEGVAGVVLTGGFVSASADAGRPSAAASAQSRGIVDRRRVTVAL